MTPIGCFAGFVIDSKFLLAIMSLISAAIILLVLKRLNLSTKLRISLIYSHLTFLFFPLVLFSMNFGCGVFCMTCYNDILYLLTLTLPSTLIASTIAGFVVIPSIYIFSNKSRVVKNGGIINFIKTHSTNLSLKVPKLYILNRAKPIAFSFRSFKSAIFVSVGLLEILNRKETEAVLLHELHHIKQKSSILKFSNSILKLFSPMSILVRFNKDSNKEEREADKFVVHVQKTDKNLLSAKRKINEYNTYK